MESPFIDIFEVSREDHDTHENFIPSFKEKNPLQPLEELDESPTSYSSPFSSTDIIRIDTGDEALLEDEVIFERKNEEDVYDLESFNFYESSDEENEALTEPSFASNELQRRELGSMENIFNEYEIHQAHGISDYLDVSAVKGHYLKTGIFIPASYNSSSSVDVVIYLHGLFSDGDKSNGIDSYWNSYSNIREYFYASGRNAILIAPGLGRNPQDSDVFYEGLDIFLNNCLSKLESKNYVKSGSIIGKIIMAAHSAGGKPLGIILNSSSRYVPNIVECWGFDCLYSNTWGKLINDWAHGNNIFYHYWAWSCSASNLDKCPRVIGDRFQKINPTNFKNIGPKGKIGHRQIIEDAWRGDINTRKWFNENSVLIPTPVKNRVIGDIATIYALMKLEEVGLPYDVFAKAFNGYRKLDVNNQLKNNRILSIVDFTQSSKNKRLYILDMVKNQVLLQTNVAHGEKSGTKEFATHFSNNTGSHQSSLGFYVTLDTYTGKNGYSLKLEGMEPGFNDKAKSRAIVVHGAAYVKEGFVSGRSWGCPAVPMNKRDEVINTMKGGTCLFIYFDDQEYLNKSLLVKNLPEPFHEADFLSAYDFMDEAYHELETHDGDNLELNQYLHENYEEESAAMIDFESENPLPAPMPSARPIPFAPEPPKGSYWPIQTKVTEGRLVSYLTVDGGTVGSSSRKFMADRKTSEGVPRYHVGIDLYANFNEPVIACDDGKILSFSHFYTTKGGNPTNKLIVQHSNVIINYGEVGPSSLGRLNLKVGSPVMAGQVIGFVGATGMLHFETYKIMNDSKELPPHRWMKSDPNPPASLYNPTKYLLYLKQYGLSGSGVNANAPTVPNTTTTSTNDRWANAVNRNRYYAEKLGWNKFHNKINDLILPYSGLSNVSLDEEAFAEAIAAWQRSLGFSTKDSDGIIGPVTWEKIKSILDISNNTIPKPLSSSSFKVDNTVVSRIKEHSAVIEQQSTIQGINPNLVRGIIASESDGKARAGEGTSGYKGLMMAERTVDQLRPSTSLESGIKKFIVFRDKILNPWLLKLGLLPSLIDEENYLKMCLSCYNAGPVTALKAIQYASKGGDWRQWLSPENYKRALVFSGGYNSYPVCTKGISEPEITKAKSERIKYRFKTSGWRTEVDPDTWSNIYPKLHTVMRCWIETKYNNTPGYLNKFIHYYQYFQGTPTAHELLEASGYEYERTFYEKADDNEFEHEDFYEMDDFIVDLSKGVRLNQHYGEQLGWNKNYDQINDLLLPYSGQQNVSLGEEDFVQALALWQQQQGFSVKDADGILGPHTWSKMKPLLGKTTQQQSSTPSSVPMHACGAIAMPSIFTTIQFSVSKEIAKGASESSYNFTRRMIREIDENPDIWYQNFVKTTFLGVSFNDPIYIELANLLKNIETKFINTYDPVKRNICTVRQRLGITTDSFSGGRSEPTAAIKSMHLFGLALDVNMMGNPFIQNKAIRHEKYTQPNGVDTINDLLANADRLFGVATIRFQYHLSYDSYFSINSALTRYFKIMNDDAMLQQALNTTASSEWKSRNLAVAKAKIQKDLDTLATALVRWTKRDQLRNNGFLNLSKEFVDGMVAGGLDWGGAGYGDMMHFDMRITGVGKKIHDAISKS